MSAAAPGELRAASVIAQIESGAYGRDVVATIARGFLPLEQNDLIEVLSFLAAHEDEEIANLARASLSEVPPRALFEYAANESISGEPLERLMRATNDAMVLEALIRNRVVSDGAVVELARRAEARLQEVIVINQARILRAPQILEALLENPALSPDARRRALEVREEFFLKKARVQHLEEEEEEEEIQAEVETAKEEEEPEVVDLPLDDIADLLAQAAVQGDAVENTLSLTELEKTDDEKAPIWARLHYLSVSEKVQLAFKGDRTIRMLLVRDRNKLICNAVMRNPRMTMQEVENIAGMRNVDESVLRIIGTKKDWSGKYNIMVILSRNPKTPVGVVLPFINRLTLRDLKGLKDDKGVPQIVRETAKKLYLSRTQKTG